MTQRVRHMFYKFRYFSVEQIQYLINPAPPTNHELIPLQYGLLLASSPSSHSLINMVFRTFFTGGVCVWVAFPFHYPEKSVL